MHLTDSVINYMKTSGIRLRDVVVVGVSGGADSMCLLSVLHAISLQRQGTAESFSLIAAHVNHGLRGETADRDETLVRTFCASNAIPFEVNHISVQDIATMKKIGVEEAGRIARYDFFQSLAGESGSIAVAHHREDQAETIAMNIMRGTGLDGLCGMKPQKGRIIRPLLMTSKEEILSYCREANIPYGIDETNQDNHYRRNFVRNTLFPLLHQETGNQPVDAYIALSEVAQQALTVIDASLVPFWKEHPNALTDGIIEVESLRSLRMDLRPFAIRQMFSAKFGNCVDFSSRELEAVLRIIDSDVGNKRLHLGHERMAFQAKGIFHFVWEGELQPPKTGGMMNKVGVLLPKEICFTPLLLSDIPLGTPYQLPQTCLTLTLQIVENENDVVYNDLAWYFYAKRLNDMVLRTRLTGDCIKVAGSSCHKALRHFMTEKGIPSDYRDSLLIVARMNEVLWLPSIAHADGFTDADSRRYFLNVDAKQDKLYRLEIGLITEVYRGGEMH